MRIMFLHGMRHACMFSGCNKTFSVSRRGNYCSQVTREAHFPQKCVTYMGRHVAGDRKYISIKMVVGYIKSSL